MWTVIPYCVESGRILIQSVPQSIQYILEDTIRDVSLSWVMHTGHSLTHPQSGHHSRRCTGSSSQKVSLLDLCSGRVCWHIARACQTGRRCATSAATIHQAVQSHHSTLDCSGAKRWLGPRSRSQTRAPAREYCGFLSLSGAIDCDTAHSFCDIKQPIYNAYGDI